MGLKEKIGNPTERSDTGSLYRKDNIVFFVLHLPCVESRRKLYLPDNVPANEFLNLEGNKLSTSKKLGSLLHEYLEDSQVSKMFCVMH
jgi:methionyl-tRNA synthetase